MLEMISYLIGTIRESTCLVLLDLSAVFDTLGHVTVLNCLQNRFKIIGSLLKWIESYLSNRSQAVVLKNEKGETAMSNVVTLSRGIPQGSVLGPLLFTLFPTPLGDICRQHDQDFHLYADVTCSYMHHSLLHLKSPGSPVWSNQN